MLTTFCVVLCFAACSSNTPSGVAEQSIKYLMEEKYDKYTDLLYVSDADKEDPEKLKKDKEEFTQLLEAKYSETVKIPVESTVIKSRRRMWQTTAKRQSYISTSPTRTERPTIMPSSSAKTQTATGK